MTDAFAASGGGGTAGTAGAVRKHEPAGAHKPRGPRAMESEFGAMLLASGVLQVGAGATPGMVGHSRSASEAASTARPGSKSGGGKARDAADVRLATAESTRALKQSSADRLRTVGSGVSLSALAQAEMAKPGESAARAELGQATEPGPVGQRGESAPRAESMSGERAGRDAFGGTGSGSAHGSPTRGGSDLANAGNAGAAASNKAASSPAPSAAAGALGALDRLAEAASRVQISRPGAATAVAAPAGGVSAAGGAGGRSGVGTGAGPATNSGTPGAIVGLGATGPNGGAAVGAGRLGSPHKPHVPREQLMQQVHRALGLALRSNDGPVTIRLTPEHLGQLRVDLSRGEAGVTARFEAATSEAQKLLESSMPELRSALEARGLQVDRLEVRLAEQPVVDAERRAAQESGDEPRGQAEEDRGEAPAEAGTHAHSGGGGHAHGQRSARSHDGEGSGPRKADHSGTEVARAVPDHAPESGMTLSTFEVVV